MYNTDIIRSSSDIFECIGVILNEEEELNKIEKQCLNSYDIKHISDVIHNIRKERNYQTLMDCPLDLNNISVGFRTTCETALYADGGPEKQCLRALTLYIYTIDICRYKLKDNDMKEVIVAIYKDVIAKYDIDWNILFQSMSYLAII